MPTGINLISPTSLVVLTFTYQETDFHIIDVGTRVSLLGSAVLTGYYVTIAELMPLPYIEHTHSPGR